MSSPSIKAADDNKNNDVEVVRIGYGPPPPQLPPVTTAALKKHDDDDESGDGEMQKNDARRQSEGFVAFNKGFDDW